MSSSSSDDWACSYCTLWNPPTKRRCAACQARRQVDLSVPTAVPVVDTTTNRRRKLSKTSPPSRKRHRPVTTPTVTSNATTSSAKETNISTTTSSTSSDRYISQPSSDVVLIPDKELASQTTNSKYKNGSDPTDPGIQQESCDARNGFSSPKPDGKRETSPIDSLTDYQPRQTSANEHSGQLCQKSNAASMILQGDCAVDENIQGDSNNSVETNPAVGTSLPKLPIVGDVSSTRRRKEEIMDETIDRTCNNNNGIGNDGTHRPWDDSTAKHILNHVPNRLNENKLLQSPTTSSGGDGTGNVQQPGYEIESSFLATEKENFQGNQNQETYLLLESTIVSDSVTNNDSSSGNVPVVNVHPRSMTDFSIRGNDTYLQDVNETLEEATSEEAIQQGTNNPIHHTLSAVTAVPQADDLPLLTSGIQPQFENNNLSQSSSCVSPKQTFFDYTPPSQLSQESERKAIPTGISHSNPANDAVECDNTELVVNLDHQQYFYRVDEQSEKILWHKREDSQEATKMSVVEKVCSIKDQKTPGLQRIGNVGTIDADESVNIESAIQLVRHSTLPFSDHNSKHHTQSRYESQADAILQAISSNATATLTKNAVHQASQLRQDTISDMDHSTTLFPQEPTCQSLRKRPLEEALQDSRSSKCQMLPAFPNPSAVPLFHTAGKGMSICVSKESLEKVGKMFEESVGSAAISNPTIPLFQTAGKGTSISVSKESLEKVGNMFEVPVGTVPVSNSTVPLFQTAGKGTSIAVSKESLEKVGKMFEVSVGSAAVSNPTISLFQTAGKGTSIAVSRENLEKVEEMFEDPVGPVSVSNSTVPLFQTAGKGTSIAVSKVFEESVDFAAVSNATVPFFQTAGKGTPIAVTKDSLEKVVTMFEEPVDSAAVSNPTIPLFQTAGKATSIAVSKESLEKVGKMFEESVESAAVSKATVPLFQTAGKGTSIAVSKERLEKARKMFEDLVDSAAVSNPTIPLFQTAGKGTSIAVSKESLEKVGKIFEDPVGAVPKSNSTVPFFQTAGKGTSIAVSKESLEKVGKMFEESVGSAAVSNPTLSLFQTAGKGTSIAVSKESLEKVGKMFEDPVGAVPKSNSTVPFFQTAGKGTSIAVSKESLEKVGKMFEESVGSAAVSNPTLSLFQTAGKGTSIAVSKESLEKVGKMFEDPVSAVPISNSTVPFFQTAGKGASIAVSKESLAKADKLLRKVESDYFYDSLSSKGLSATRSIEEQEGVEWHRNNDVVLSKEGNVFSCDYKTRTSLYTLADVENTITLDEEQVTTTPDHPTFSRSARVTIATDDEFFVRKHLPGQLSFMTPVPLKYNGEEGTCNADIEIPVIHSDSVQESKDTVCLNLSYAQKYGLMSSSHDECVAHGVREATIKVNSLNALQIAFDNDGFPATILSDARSDSESDRLLRDIRRSLIEEGCDSLQLKDKWIRIHARWVIWKLAAYERRFSRFLAGRHLTYDRLIHDLKSRFQREMVEGRRSPLRRILNCDASPKTMMILVVSQTLSSPSMKDGDCKLQKLKILEVSDGWHAIKAELDSKLSKFVENNLIKVGTKLLVSNAQIVGVGEGVDPLDTSSEGDSALLQLSANATRLARWNAKLGLVKVSPSQAPKGRLLLKRLSDVVEGGGNVPAISLFIQRVYPIMYYEKSEGDSSNPVTDSSTCRQVLSEQEEENRRREFEGKKTRAVEYVTEKIQAEIEQEVDQDAPEVWKRVYNSSTPEDMYQTLAESDQEEIARWREHRSTLIQRRIQDEVEAELETHKSLLRKSAPFLRIKVHSVYPRKHKRESGLLTIWHPSEEHLNSLKEGSCVQAFDLSVRDTLYNGQLQLTANKRTIIEALPEDSFSETKEQVFVERRYLSLIDVHMISHIKAKESEDADPVEFDTVATCFNVTESSKTDEVVLHLIDETCLVLRVHCKSLPYILKVLLGEESGVITSFALRDLRLRSFDTHQQCAVAEFTDLSSVISTNDRIEELAFWAENEGSAEVLAASTRLEVGLPEWEQCEEERVGFGYIMGLRVEEKSQTLYIQVDCCGFCCQDWELPFSVLQNMVSVDSPGVTSSIHSPSLENRMERLGLLGLILRSRGTLWEFQLRLNRKHSNFNAFVVTKATPANNSMLCNLYLTLPELELPDAKEEGVTF